MRVLIEVWYDDITEVESKEADEVIADLTGRCESWAEETGADAVIVVDAFGDLLDDYRNDLDD